MRVSSWCGGLQKWKDRQMSSDLIRGSAHRMSYAFACLGLWRVSRGERERGRGMNRWTKAAAVTCNILNPHDEPSNPTALDPQPRKMDGGGTVPYRKVLVCDGYPDNDAQQGGENHRSDAVPAIHALRYTKRVQR